MINKNPINNKCFQYASTGALNYEQIGKHSEGIIIAFPLITQKW